VKVSCCNQKGNRISHHRKRPENRGKFPLFGAIFPENPAFFAKNRAKITPPLTQPKLLLA
jgi:hypothetical protein